MSFEGTYHYVRHADVPAFEGVGWKFAFGLGRPHGTYSVCMKWAGEGDPRVPLRTASQIQNEETR
jgi:hypothetical protein